MKSIVVLLLLLAVSTSGNKMYSWQNLTGVHEDKGLWDSLAGNGKYLTILANDATSNCGPKPGACTGIVNGMKFSDCPTYTRCKRLVTDST